MGLKHPLEKPGLSVQGSTGRSRILPAWLAFGEYVFSAIAYGPPLGLPQRGHDWQRESDKPNTGNNDPGGGALLPLASWLAISVPLG
jgi:hypothetical protein